MLRGILRILLAGSDRTGDDHERHAPLVGNHRYLAGRDRPARAERHTSNEARERRFVPQESFQKLKHFNPLQRDVDGLRTGIAISRATQGI